jgi:hypothetical protein
MTMARPTLMASFARVDSDIIARFHLLEFTQEISEPNTIQPISLASYLPIVQKDPRGQRAQ